MGKFNLNEYEEVKDRIKRFYDDNPEGRIITEMVNDDINTVIFKAYIHLSDKPTVKSTGYAFEKAGEGYVNKTSHLENCETSAIGRALANCGYHGDKRPSKEEMLKVQKEQEKAKKEQNKPQSIVDTLKIECKKSGLAWEDCSAWIKKQYAGKYEDAVEAMNVNYDEILNYIYGRIDETV